MSEACDCCERNHAEPAFDATGASGLSRPGAPRVRRSSFLAAAIRRLCDASRPELAVLTRRDPGDFSIALLDGWSTIADVLMFYQERFVNEGFLATATERRSLLELARLIGYEPRPGVAATVHLAYTIEKGTGVTQIPPGSRVASVPDPGEQMQTFETTELLEAADAWNEWRVRSTQAQTAQSIIDGQRVYLRGITTQLKVNDALLIVPGGDLANAVPVRVSAVQIDANADLTRVELSPWTASRLSAAELIATVERYEQLEEFDVTGHRTLVRKVLQTLKEVRSRAADRPVAEVREFLERDVLPFLEETHGTIVEREATALEPWLAELTEEMQLAADGLVEAPPRRVPERPDTASFFERLTGTPALNPRSSRSLHRSIERTFAAGADTVPQLLTRLRPPWRGVLYKALHDAARSATTDVSVYAFRRVASLFGSNAPREPIYEPPRIGDRENPRAGQPLPQDQWTEWRLAADERPNRAFLDAQYDELRAGSYTILHAAVVSTKHVYRPLVRRIADVLTLSRTAYGTSARTTRITLDRPWWRPAIDHVERASRVRDGFAAIRGTTVFCQSERLELAPEPIPEPLCGEVLELDGLFDGLKAGRWIIVAGERADLVAPARETPVRGLNASELAMIGGVRHGWRGADGSIVSAALDDPDAKPRPDEQLHTFIELVRPLTYCYRRDTMRIHGNVVAASHGETRRETLGGGNAAEALQRFDLKQRPVTFLPAPTPSGAASSLEVRVQGVRWREVSSFAALEPQMRGYVTKRDDEERCSIVFGTGGRGARLPTGIDNVTAVYRTGIGKPGNVRAGQITLLTDRPLGVRDVVNPIRASGGADRDTSEHLRTNAPAGAMALDRLVSVRDYADFSRTFAGVGRAVARALSDGQRQVVGVTIAGVDDGPIDISSGLFENLDSALRRFGDPALPLRLLVRERLVVVLSAAVKLLPDYSWELVEPKIRAALLRDLGFERISLGERVHLSRAMRCVQGVTGVEYVDIDVFDAVSAETLLAQLASATPAVPALREFIDVQPMRLQAGEIRAAQIAYVANDFPDTLILTERRS